MRRLRQKTEDSATCGGDECCARLEKWIGRRYTPAKKVFDAGDGNRVHLFCVKISPIRFFPGAHVRARALIEAIRRDADIKCAELEVKQYADAVKKA